MVKSRAARAGAEVGAGPKMKARKADTRESLFSASVFGRLSASSFSLKFIKGFK